jgi:hypothetical protein
MIIMINIAIVVTSIYICIQSYKVSKHILKYLNISDLCSLPLYLNVVILHFIFNGHFRYLNFSPMYWRYSQNISPYMVQYLLRVLKFHCHGNRYTDKT